MVSLDECLTTAKKLGISLIDVTGEKGKIGALAAIGLHNNVKEAVKLYC